MTVGCVDGLVYIVEEKGTLVCCVTECCTSWVHLWVWFVVAAILYALLVHIT